jgi:hypothetical protein
MCCISVFFQNTISDELNLKKGESQVPSNSIGLSGIQSLGNTVTEIHSPDHEGIIGPSCQSRDPTYLCLALKYVVYKDFSEKLVTHQKVAIKNIYKINQIWKSCRIGFQIEKFYPALPKKYQLRYQPADEFELTDIRKGFQEESTLLVVTTGKWNRSRSLGSSLANAWTSLPGEPPYGAILERPVAGFANIIAHELGHYLNLLHVNDSSDLMNAVIYEDSEQLTVSQCSSARLATLAYWQRMLR